MRRTKPKFIFDVVTLFPSMFHGPLSESILGRAQNAGILTIRVHSLRQWSDDPRHQKVDDRPYGGGSGMVMRAEPIFRAIHALGGMKKSRNKPWIVYLSPKGTVFNQNQAITLSKKKHILLICGHYEGVDERVLDWVDQEISIGDFVLTGGEIPALTIVDAVCRLVPGVVGDPESVEKESFSNNFLEHPHYTRPRVWKGREVPGVLLAGNHRDIGHWREQQAKSQTQLKRPDLLKKKFLK